MMIEKKPGIVSGGQTSAGDGGKASGIVSGGSSQLTQRDEHATDTYTVVKGDSLSKIAQRFYGKASLWPRIHEANGDQISDPDRIYPGQVLRIPQV